MCLRVPHVGVTPVDNIKTTAAGTTTTIYANLATIICRSINYMDIFMYDLNWKVVVLLLLLLLL